MSGDFDALLRRLSSGEDLSSFEMTDAISRVMTGGCSEQQIELLLTALKEKGETVEEVAGAAIAMRKHMTAIRSRHPQLLDTCGTGGGSSKTFNISTTSALVIASAGVPVAKHGNRSVTSKSGSADVLAALGVNIEATVPQVERCLDELGICFCFAPLMHPAMKHVGAVRKKMAVRTIFNLLGPLANPAGAQFQLLGVGIPALRPLIASALRLIGVERALVVSGRDGMGEVTLADETDVTQVEGNQETEFTWSPADFGIERSDLTAIQIEGPQQSAEMVRQVLAGQHGPARNIVVLNVAAGLIAAGCASQPEKAASLAAESIDSGAAAALLERLARLSHESV